MSSGPQLSDWFERPWRIFFPPAALGGMFGLLLWPLAPLPYAMRWHPDVMIALFLTPLATGFLLHAGPRFLAAAHANAIERIGAFVLLAIQWTCLVLNNHDYFLVCAALSLGFLLVFLLRRMNRENWRRLPFPSFLVAGLSMGFVGLALRLAAPLLPDSGAVEHVGRFAYLHGYFWTIFVGLSVRLAPMMRFPRPEKRRWLARIQELAQHPWHWPLAALILALTFLDRGGPEQQGLFLVRTLITLWIAFVGWRLFQGGERRGVIPFLLDAGLWLAALALLYGAIVPGAWKHTAHALFLGAYGLTALCIVTRVTLAHEGADMHREIDSRLLAVAGAFVLAGMLTRISAPYLKSYLLHLNWAAIFAASGFALWAATLVYYVLHARKAPN